MQSPFSGNVRQLPYFVCTVLTSRSAVGDEAQLSDFYFLLVPVLVFSLRLVTLTSSFLNSQDSV